MSIEITPALLADLRQNAEAATIEYDWKLYDDQKNWPVIEFGNRPGEDCGGFTIKGNYAPKLTQDAAHIAAANPAVVLALVAEVERLRLFQAVAVEVIDKLNNYHECSDPDQCRSCDQINAGIEAISKAKREASNDY